jgi:hypothetical protein
MDDIIKIASKIPAIRQRETLFPYPFGLRGKLGVCIMMDYLNRFKANAEFEKCADDLLDEVYTNTNDLMPLDIDSGITGIGLGISHLIEQGFVDENVNEALIKIDVPIYKNIVFPKEGVKTDYLLTNELLYYCINRFKQQQHGSEEAQIFKSLLFKLLNAYVEFPEKLMDEPVAFSLRYPLPFFLHCLGLLAELEPFYEKIRQMAEEITYRITTHIPLLAGHSLYLLSGMQRLMKTVQIPLWEKHAARLRNEIDIQDIIKEEIHEPNIFFTDGLAGLWYLVDEYNQSSDEKIVCDSGLFEDRIFGSTSWRKLLHDDIFLKENIGLSQFGSVVLQLLKHLKT